ncbi:OLC1v1003448C1 [Oldenlandia corymbosa var. corymbosa]|uniref:OLC1v1003448C1 n=1 Tax=Oldenlandia corymbosa var. corymbosa TaxID=529605 RepID=A0AAV1DD23_OLDCO|nr:OLC1v1003448C1 [Oldenlandia corymbosa var. corymbosa]
MATTATANAEEPSTSSGTKTVDASLWWDSFTLLLHELENSSVSSDLPPSLAKKLKDHHAWFLDTTTMFKPPDPKSREALDSKKLKIGSRELIIRPELKEAALEASSVLGMNEVQSYIIVERTAANGTLGMDATSDDTFHSVVVQYYIERQCLLKCTRLIIMNALLVGSGSNEVHAMWEGAQKLISDGLEVRLLSVLEGLLVSDYPEQLEVDLFTLWAEETLIEVNLVLEIIFLSYYDGFAACNGKHWKKLLLVYEGFLSGSFNLGKLSISAEAEWLAYYAKMQLLLILIETLDLENLLQMTHDETPFRQSSVAFSVVDIEEIDKIISAIDLFQAKEAGPLVLAWAIFLCLILSLPEAEDNHVLLEMDHVDYVRQAIEASSLSYVLAILQSKIWQESDAPTAGYRCVLRTFISAFVASYEINLQLEDDNLRLILDILCMIYRSEESLCNQFWDRESFLDGPIRCLLCNMEGEFPFRVVEFVRFLSALCEGAWPAECVYNFLEKSVGLSTPFEINSESLVDRSMKIVQTHVALPVPGVQGLIIPRGTRGQVLRMINKDCALVRWEHAQSGVTVLLYRMAQELYSQSSEEVLVTLDLLSRLVTFNLAVCNSLLNIPKSSSASVSVEGLQEYSCVNVVEMICALVKNVPSTSYGAKAMSMGVKILTKMLKCSPYHVGIIILKSNIFDVNLRQNSFDVTSSGLSRESWLLSGRLSKMLMIDCEQNDCSLTLSVLELTIQLVEMGLETDMVFGLVLFSFQYVLVNHEIWNYSTKHMRWEVTLKVLQVVKTCILTTSQCKRLSSVIQDILLSDSSVHNALFQIVCTTTQGLERLYISRLHGPMDLGQIQDAISSGLDVLFSMLYFFSKDLYQNISVFHQAVLSLAAKPVSVVTAAISLMSFFRNSKIQVNAARLLSMLFATGAASQSFALGNACLGLDDTQICEFRNSICRILLEQSIWNEELVVAAFRLLTSAASYQPAFLAAVINPGNAATGKHLDEANVILMDSKGKSLVDVILLYFNKPDDHMKRKPKILSNVLNFLKALWQSAPQFSNFLEKLKNSENFWRRLSDCVMLSSNIQDRPSQNLKEQNYREEAYERICQSNMLEIVACEIFLHKKLLHIEFVEQTSMLPEGSKLAKDGSISGLKDLVSSWFKSSLLGNLIESYASYASDCRLDSLEKVYPCLFSVHAMAKLKSGNMGCMSVHLIEKILNMSEKLTKLPAFSELLALYLQRGYSQGKEPQHLIISDLFYHLQGEIEGRQIDDRLVRELVQYLLHTDFLQSYLCKADEDFQWHIMGGKLYDTGRLQSELGLELWDLLSEWRESKSIAEKMLRYLDDVNGRLLLSNAKLSALKALVAMLFLCSDDSGEHAYAIGGKFPEQLLLSCVDHTCQFLIATVDLLPPDLDDSRHVLDILGAQAELLLYLVKSGGNKFSSSSCFLLIKASGHGLKVLSGFSPSDARVKEATKLLLMLVHFSVKIGHAQKQSDTTGATVVEATEISNMIIGLLPILCHCTQTTDHYKLSLTIIDIIVRAFSTPAVWFPVIQKHLQLPYVLQKLQDKDSVETIPAILQFLLTLSRVREGAVMFVNNGFFAFLRWFFTELPDDQPSSFILSEKSLMNSMLDQSEKPKHIWGLSLAVITAVIHSLEGSSSSAGVVDYVMAHFFVEKSLLISYYLSAPDFPSSSDHDKKRARSLKRCTTLASLKETEQTLLLICVLARHGSLWGKAMKVGDSQLRERIIHLLAFISRGTQHHGEFHNRVAPLLCHPVVKDEFELYKKPSFVNSRNGWFLLSPLGCGLDPKFSSLSSRTNALLCKDQSNSDVEPAPQTYFSDITAIQIYKITFLLLEFLCIQAKASSKRAEDVGFVDLATFPELPVPDILHGLQDQAISIVTELCEAGNKSKLATPELQDLCILLLKIIEMALYLELCVIQICGLRPVLGHGEYFLKEIKALIKATEGHSFLKEAMMALKQIVVLVYPELHAEVIV